MTHSYDAQPYRSGDPYADYTDRIGTGPSGEDFTRLADLADRRFGAGVIAANDEFFAERENLLKPGPARFDPTAFAHKGKVMDGWETRRRRGPGAGSPHPGADDHDWALIRLGAPGVIHGVVVDTAHFRGNYPQRVSLEAAAVEGTPGPERLLADDVTWHELLPPTRVYGHSANGFAVADGRRWTHLRLRQYPDGGIARLRVHGEVVPDPSWLDLLGTSDLGSALNGCSVEDASDRFFSDPANITLPGISLKMDDGWEVRRRRDTGHDWVRLRLAAEGEIRAVEIDTANYKGNAAGWVALHGSADGGETWSELLPRTALEPDAPHRFALSAPAAVTHVRLDVFPDGGIARLRLHGGLTERGREELRRKCARSAPDGRD
ncbi:allantoicase [Streptomyces sp. HNM0574]|uniref:allantoicase n=1 Tax=Streptomyces sp. HNM0574 TaxID=2714954 RepID=UPI00146E6299|nr:allantoicase [Streptomyces sp. HNM0574]